MIIEIIIVNYLDSVGTGLEKIGKRLEIILQDFIILQEWKDWEKTNRMPNSDSIG